MTVLVDTDVLIWNLRGNEKAAKQLDRLPAFSISAVTYMELAQGMRDKRELRTLKQAITYWSADIIHINRAVSSRASFLVEQYSLSNSIQLADALIAATALESGLSLLTANGKHYRPVDGLDIKLFKP